MYRLHARYLFDELLNDVNSGHNIIGTVAMEGHRMYRKDGPEEFRSVGEVEFLNGVAAVAASGVFGPTEGLCAAIVGGVDLRLGDFAEDVLLAQMQAGGGGARGGGPVGVCFYTRTC